jgi:protein gp37
MAQLSSIEWTESTWNPVTGCNKISPGCKFCYAERLAKRLKAMGSQNYANGFNLTLQPNQLYLPLEWKKPRVIFVNSMSDLFHEEIPTEYIKKIFDIMNKAHWHTFQILTKRSENLVQLAPHLNWSKNIWMGVSVENNDYVHRIKDLIKIPASVRFLSLEPLIGPLPGLRLRGIDWVIVGGESGPGCRPIEISWARDIRDKCNSMNVPFFFKQWGGVHKKRKGRKLDNKYWDEMPIVKERRVLKKSMIE